MPTDNPYGYFSPSPTYPQQGPGQNLQQPGPARYPAGVFRRRQRRMERFAHETGLNTLLGILGSQGATDPRLMNQQLTSIQRQTEAGVGGLEESLASRGFGQSGVGAALQAAMMQGGQERVSNRLAEEAALQEQRKRDDLNLLLQLIISPKLTRRGQNIEKLLGMLAAKGGGGGGGIGDLLGPALGTIGGGMSTFAQMYK